MRGEAMAQSFGWAGPARRYTDLYRRFAAV
jgi:hypothetical protein